LQRKQVVSPLSKIVKLRDHQRLLSDELIHVLGLNVNFILFGLESGRLFATLIIIVIFKA
jgi:hypothetical protein